MPKTLPGYLRLLGAMVGSCLLLACSDGNGISSGVTEPGFLAVPNPTMSLPPDEGTINLLAMYWWYSYALCGSVGLAPRRRKSGKQILLPVRHYRTVQCPADGQSLRG